MAGTYIYWNTPDAIIATGAVYWDKVRVYRGPSEQLLSAYVLIDTLASQTGGIWLTNYTDTSFGNDTSQWYLVRYYNSVALVESTNFATCYLALTPREQRLITVTQHMMDPRLYTGMQTYDWQNALNMSLQLFNLQPPPTSYTWSDLPSSYESLVSMGSMMTAVLQRFLGVSMRDFSYSDQGLNLTLDLQGKMKGAMDEVWRLYQPMIKLMKLEEAPSPMGLGSWSIPLGFAGRMSGSLLNVLDLYRSFSY